MAKLYEYPEAKQVVVCGDVHGKFDELVYRITTMHGMTDTVIIVAGDCGFGFHRRGYYDQVLQRVLPKLEKARCWVVFVRGNHDNPAYFDGEEISHKRWCCVGDYSVVVTRAGNILCVGGATSVDRVNREDYQPMPDPVFASELLMVGEMRERLMKSFKKTLLLPKDYWMNEAPYFDEDALSSIYRAGRSIQAVVSHIPPSVAEDVAPPSWLGYLTERDPALLDDMRRDRKTMDALLGRLHRDCHPVRHWLYGHYHHSWSACIDGINYTMLRELEMKELR